MICPGEIHLSLLFTCPEAYLDLKSVLTGIVMIIIIIIVIISIIVVISIKLGTVS